MTHDLYKKLLELQQKSAVNLSDSLQLEVDSEGEWTGQCRYIVLNGINNLVAEVLEEVLKFEKADSENEDEDEEEEAGDPFPEKDLLDNCGPWKDGDDSVRMGNQALTYGPKDEKTADKKEPVITNIGIQVFEDDELDIKADPNAKTLLTGGPLDDVDEGSGLLDLTNEPDDTSLGAELLEGIDVPDDDPLEAHLDDPLEAHLGLGPEISESKPKSKSFWSWLLGR